MTNHTTDSDRRDERDLRAQYETLADASRVLHQFGAWFVTEYGVEGLNRGSIYAIEAERLWEDHERGSSWEDHLLGKTWMTESDAADMQRALARGRELYAAKKPR